MHVSVCYYLGSLRNVEAQYWISGQATFSEVVRRDGDARESDA